jgi:hypothetical protein
MFTSQLQTFNDTEYVQKIFQKKKRIPVTTTTTAAAVAAAATATATINRH